MSGPGVETRDEPGQPPDVGLRLLVLMRHGEAAGSSPTGDMGRPLTPAGRKSAARVAEWLDEQGVRPDLAVVSPSWRTLQTWDVMRDAGLTATHVVTDDSVYDADPADLLAIIRDLSDEVRVLLVVGHAPGIPFLVDLVEDHTKLTPALTQLRHRWPPAAVGVISHRGSWADFPQPDSALAHFHAT